MGKKRVLPSWLPDGWRVEVKARKKGKKEKTEEAASEGLPSGWIKELKVWRKGRKIRKDLYYIDPVSGQTFRSMKQVSQFLETRESGKSESKPGGQPFSSLPAEAETQISLDSDASGKEVNLNQKLKLGPEHVAHSSCVEGSVSSFEGLGGAVPEKVEEEDDSKVVSSPASREHQGKEDDSKVVTDPANGEHQEKEDDHKVVLGLISGENQEKPSRDGVEKHDQKTIQRKRKKGMNVPRRASKRLAGIKANTSLQLQTNNQPHLASVRQEEGTQAATTDNPVNLKNTSKHVATPVTAISISEKVETGSLTIKRQEDRVTSSLKEREQPSPAEPAKTVLASCEGDKKGDASLESSLSDLWTDPCIEFAIKTLTGTIPVINEKKVDEILGSSPSRSSVNTPSSAGLPSDEIWADPCFMFAVKTLTGEIPIGDGLCSQKIVQQQCISSQFQGNNGVVLPNIRFEEFGQANRSHFGAPEKALYKQQPAVAPNAYQNCWFTKFGSHRPPSLC